MKIRGYLSTPQLAERIGENYETIKAWINRWNIQPDRRSPGGFALWKDGTEEELRAKVGR